MPEKGIAMMKTFIATIVDLTSNSLFPLNAG
jgi:hypothetical protein